MHGLVSYGPAECGNGIPAIYTKLSNYNTWIQENADVRSWKTEVSKNHPTVKTGRVAQSGSSRLMSLGVLIIGFQLFF